MKQKLNKTLSLILAMIMIFGTLPVVSLAADVVHSGSCGENLTWTLDSDGLLTISGSGEMRDWELVDNEYSPWYNYRRLIKTVVIANGVTSIGRRAFDGYTKLTSVEISDSITNIGCEAFYDCVKLTSVNFPDGVTSIDHNAFYNCDSLTSVTIPNSVTSIGEDAFGCHDASTIFYNFTIHGYAGSEAENYANKNRLNFIEVCFHDESSCVSSSAEIPTTCGSYGYTAGVYCNNCENWIEGHEIIYSYHTDENDDNICDICSDQIIKTIHDGECGNNLTWTYNNKQTLTISGTGEMSSVWNGWLWFEFRDYLSNVIIEDGATSIGNGTFEECISLTNITIPDSVTSIGRYAFHNCSSLTSITIPDGITSINAGTFYGCSNLTSITIPDSVTSIGEDAFRGCSSLTSINIPDSVTSIGNYAFSGCSNLTDLIIGSGITNIDRESLINLRSLENIEVSQDNAVYSSHNGVLFNKDKTTLLRYPVMKTESSYIIPDTVTHIDEKAFSECRNLTSITIPSSVSKIGEEAFYCCNRLTSITIPTSVTSIGESAFRRFILLRDGDIKSLSDFIIYGYSGSAAEVYAEEFRHTFISLGTVHTHSYTSKVTKTATCTATGIMTYTCSCGESYTKSIAKKAHTYKKTTTKATTSKNGSVVEKCTVCGNVKSNVAIAKVSTVKLSKTSFTYNGKTQKPSVTVKDSKGKTLKNGTDYTVKYSKGCKNVGQYTVTITFKGNYSGTKTLTFKIVPKGTSISKLTAGKKQFTVKWNKDSQGSGYEIQYSTSSKMKNAKTVKIGKSGTTSTTIKKLKSGKKYYVRVRTYKTIKVNGKSVKLYSSWSKVKNIKAK